MLHLRPLVARSLQRQSESRLAHRHDRRQFFKAMLHRCHHRNGGLARKDDCMQHPSPRACRLHRSAGLQAHSSSSSAPDPHACRRRHRSGRRDSLRARRRDPRQRPRPVHRRGRHRRGKPQALKLDLRAWGPRAMLHRHHHRHARIRAQGVEASVVHSRDRNLRRACPKTGTHHQLRRMVMLPGLSAQTTQRLAQAIHMPARPLAVDLPQHPAMAPHHMQVHPTHLLAELRLRAITIVRALVVWRV